MTSAISLKFEVDPVRKALVGACLLADRSVEEMQAAKAGLIFVVYGDEGKRQINNFRDKVKVVRRRFPHLSSIEVVTQEDFEVHGVGVTQHSTRRTETPSSAAP